MNFFSATNWRLLKTAQIDQDDFSLTTKYSGNPLLIKVSTQAKNLLSNKAGLIYQGADIQGLGRVQITDKVSIDFDNLAIFCWRKMPSYQLFFERSGWINTTLKIQIYQSIMPLEFEPQQSNNKGSTVGGTPVNTSASSVTLLAANANRKALRIVNTSNRDLYINLGATATLASYAAKLPKLPASGIPSAYENDVYTGVVSGIWDSVGSGSAQVIEVLP